MTETEDKIGAEGLNADEPKVESETIEEPRIEPEGRRKTRRKRKTEKGEVEEEHRVEPKTIGTDKPENDLKETKRIQRKKYVEEERVAKNVGPTIFGLPPTYLLLAIVVVLVLAAGIFISNKSPSGRPSKDTTLISGGVTSTITAASSDYGKVKLDFYVMSQCPYGTQVEDAVKPVLDKLGDAVDFNLNFIASDLGGGRFSSLHGQGEVDENIRQLCAIKYYPKKYRDYIVCRNKDIRSPDWQSCAREAGLDVSKIQACFDGDEGKRLHSESIKKSAAANAQGSPTIYVNNQLYSGGRDSLSFQRALCANLQSHPECANIPACGQDADCQAQPGNVGKCENPNTKDAKCTYVDDVKFEVIVLNDKNCGSCDTSRIIQAIKQLFLGATQRFVDVSSDEGKKLVGDLGISVVPAYLFESKVTQSYGWTNNPRMRGSFEKVGEYYKLSDQATGARWFVSEEARKKYQTAIGLTPGDNKPQIDFFVMSYCPYGNQAEELIAKVYDALGDKASFIPHYVIYENYGGGGPNFCLENGKYCSMHGIQELNQDIRELCVFKQSDVGKYFEFVKAMNAKCNAQNADTCWAPVAQDLGLDTATVGKCEKDEVLALVQKEKELNQILKVSGSPTVFVEGEEYNGPRSVAGFMTALCAKYDTKPSECANIPSEPPTQAIQQGGGCGS